MKAKFLKKILRFFILPVVILAISNVSYFRLLDNYELETLDIRFRLRPKIATTDKVVIIEIGDDTIKKLGRFPLERSYHALLVKALSEYGAKAIVFDIFFSEPGKDDREFEDAMREAGTVYLPFVFELESENRSKILTAAGYAAKELENFSILAKGRGHINVIPDPDGKFRRAPLYIKYGNAFYPYLSFLVACDYLGILEKDVRILPGKYLACGADIKIPLDDNSNIIVNFSGRWGESYKHYSYADVLQSYFARIMGKRPILDPSALKDKICFIGLTAVGTPDLHPTPFEPLYPAAGMHAEVLNSILNKNFISRASRAANLSIVLSLAFLISLAAFSLRPMKGLLTLVVVIFALILSGVLLFNFFGIWVDLFVPTMAMVLIYLFLTFYRYIVEWRKRLVLENELQIAKKIQESFLPKELPSVSGIDVAVSMFTARQVGGDLYDFVRFGPERLGVMVGDVSGKGIPASLFMAMVAGAFKSFAMPQARAEEVLLNLNSKLVRESSSNLFVTLFYSIFDVRKKVMAYANGGHLPALYLGKDGRSEFLDVEEGAPLGLIEGLYSSKEISFKEDDLFVFYSDGVTEAMNSKSELYGKDRLEAVIKMNKGLSAKAILNAIERDVRRFEPKARQHDDMTVIVVRIT